jgi:hypothetical protein
MMTNRSYGLDTLRHYPAANQAACPLEAPYKLGVNTSDDGFSFGNGLCKYVTNNNLLPVGIEVGKSAWLAHHIRVNV